MAITTLDGYIGAAKQKIVYQKASATSVAANWHTLLNLAGTPGAGSIGNINSSINGRVPTVITAGFPTINPFGASATGYVTGFQFADSVAGRFMLYDRVWEAGAFPTTPIRLVPLTTNASTYEYRVPVNNAGARDWSTLEMWVDVSTAFAASAVTIALNYINQDGAAKTTPATLTLASFATGRTFQMPLAAGDRGVQRITDISVGGTAAATGQFNVYLARSLYVNPRVNIANYSDVHGFEKLGMPIIDGSAALALNYAADSTATGVVNCIIEIVNG